MTEPALRLGSRKSPMAIVQSELVARLITERTGRRVEIVGVTTLGDVSRDQLTQIGGTGVFVSALREALLGGEVDLAVHSLKDLPAGAARGIRLAAVPPRDDPRDALAARDGAKLADLPAGARIGTGSPRRAAQLLALRGDLQTVPIRGNAGTRLRKVSDGELDGVVLACAGLARIGHTAAITQVFELDEMLPAPGQGALAVECRDDDPELAGLLAAVNDEASMAAAVAERSLLEALAAGCSAPVGGYAAGTGQLAMRAAVLSPDGTRALRTHGSAPAADARRLGQDLAAELLRRGAADFISSLSSRNDVQ
jgi:hydroxymethylbilane synthase